MNEKWLIDGYNVLYGLAGKNTKPSLKSVVEELSSFASFSKISVLVVLDGTGQDAELLPYKTTYLEVVYSKDISADAYIEKYVFTHKARLNLLVVTRDQAILQLARGGGARTMNIEEFKARLRQAAADMSGVRFEAKLDAHGFNRPFSDKLKNFKA